jgi:DNA-binding NarL/FixJ family response regulator
MFGFSEGKEKKAGVEKAPAETDGEKTSKHERDAKIKKLIEEGKKPKEIAEYLNVHETTIYRAIQKINS